MARANRCTYLSQRSLSLQENAWRYCVSQPRSRVFGARVPGILQATAHLRHSAQESAVLRFLFLATEPTASSSYPLSIDIVVASAQKKVKRTAADERSRQLNFKFVIADVSKTDKITRNLLLCCRCSLWPLSTTMKNRPYTDTGDARARLQATQSDSELGACQKASALPYLLGQPYISKNNIFSRSYVVSCLSSLDTSTSVLRLPLSSVLKPPTK